MNSMFKLTNNWCWPNPETRGNVVTFLVEELSNQSTFELEYEQYTMKLITVIVILCQALQIKSQSKFVFNNVEFLSLESFQITWRCPSCNITRKWIIFDRYLHWKKRSFWPRRHFFRIQYLSSHVCNSSTRSQIMVSFIRQSGLYWCVARIHWTDYVWQNIQVS